MMRRMLATALIGSWPLVVPTPVHAAVSHLTIDITFNVLPDYVWIQSSVSVDEGRMRMGVTLSGPTGTNSYQGEDWKLGPDTHFGGFAVKPGGVYRSTVCAEAEGAWGTERRCAERTRAFPEPVADFNGDGMTDISVWRPADNGWYVLGPAGEEVKFAGHIWRDQVGDTPVPADYDDDNRADPGIRKPPLSTWEFQLSTVRDTVLRLGADEDVTVPADYAGDGSADVAVFQPRTGTWSIIVRRPVRRWEWAPDERRTVQWGMVGDRAAPADYTGDGAADIAVYRPRNSTWYVKHSDDAGSDTIRWGSNGDVPVPGDYDGDRRADLAVYRPSTGDWHIRPSNGSAPYQVRHGQAGDLPVPGDYDGDGRVDLVVLRRGTPSTWLFRKIDGAVTQVSFGLATDVAIPSLYLPR